MSFLDLALKRQSHRRYKPDPVPDEVLEQLFEAARLAPSAHNNQPFRLYVIPTRGHEEELAKVYSRPWFSQPPYVLAVCVDKSEIWTRDRSDGRDYGDVDAAIVMDHIIMAATDLGLGTCWIAAFDPDAAREVLRLPDNIDPVVFTPIGYPDDDRREKRRRPITDNIVHFEW